MSPSRAAKKSSPAKFVIRRLPRSELPSDTVMLARFLIGKVVVHDLPAGRLSGRIVETEAYPPGDPVGTAAAILIRALEPLQGLELMERYRKTTRLLDLTRGPGRLAAAFQIDRRHDGLDLCAPGSLWLGETRHPIGPIGKTVRIGITRAADQLLRFYERGNPFVSGPKRFLRPATPRKKSSFGPN